MSNRKSSHWPWTCAVLTGLGMTVGMLSAGIWMDLFATTLLLVPSVVIGHSLVVGPPRI